MNPQCINDRFFLSNFKTPLTELTRKNRVHLLERGSRIDRYFAQSNAHSDERHSNTVKRIPSPFGVRVPTLLSKRNQLNETGLFRVLFVTENQLAVFFYYTGAVRFSFVKNSARTSRFLLKRNLIYEQVNFWAALLPILFTGK